MGSNRRPDQTGERSYREILWPVLIAWIAAIFLVTRFAEQLEQSKSSNTLVLMGALATTLIAPVIGALAIIIRRLNEVGHALNGEFQPRVGDAVEAIVGPRFDAIDHRLRMISARLQQGDEQFDAIRTQIAANSARLDTITNCDIKFPDQPIDSPPEGTP